MITILDYGMGNLGSIKNMFKRIGVDSVVTSLHSDIESAEKILLPGVGAFDSAMRRLIEGNYIELLNFKALEQRIPILGICLGMQLLTNSSDEGKLSGLKWIDAETKKFSFSSNEIKVPHMGWNYVQPSTPSKLTNELTNESMFYFVHSYYVKVANQDNSILKTNYGIIFDSAIQNNNIFGAQFHPEKSHKFGMKLLENFAKL